MKAPPRSFNALVQPLAGVHAIEASAGTGKTHSITLLWLRLLVEQRLRVDQVLVTTFTRAATAELQDRLLASLRRALAAAKQKGGSADDPEAKIVASVQPRLGRRDLAKELETALSSFDLAPIHTIHGFCQSLITRHTLELGCDPGMELGEDAREILDEIVGDRLMRDAERESVVRKDALAVARAAVKNPLGRILDPITSDQVRSRSHELLDPMLESISRIKIPEGSRRPIIREIESMRDTGEAEKFSDAQERGLLPVFRELTAAMAQAKAMYRALKVAALHPIAIRAREEFPDRKSAASLRTFDDILLTVYRALEGRGDESPLAKPIRDRFKAAIVDECQDSDGIQIDVFRRLFTEADSFLVIGDPKQSIYRFRGADLSSYQRLAAGAKRAPDMTTNFRSDPPLVEALNRLYAQRPKFGGGTAEHPIRYVEVGADAAESRITDARVKDPVLLLWSKERDRNSAKRDLARQTAEEFRRLLDEKVTIIDRETKKKRALEASDLAVLAATHGDLVLVRRELQARHLPCEQAGAGLGSVWKSDEAVDVQAWLEAVEGLEQRSDPLAAMLAFAATPLLGLSAMALDSLRYDPAKQATLARDLLGDRDDLRFQGPLPLLQRYWSDVERIDARLGSRDGERRLTNWRQLGCLLQAEWATGRSGAGELAIWLARKRGQAEDDDDGTMMKLETDLPAVQLATIFAAKGLEYPVVCCPFLWHVKSRQKRKDTPVAVVRRPEGTMIDIGSERFDRNLAEALAQEDEEQERLLYVALTRARHRLYVGLAPAKAGDGHDNGAERSALAELLTLDKTDKSQWAKLCPIPRLTLDPEAVLPASAGGGTDTERKLAVPPHVDIHRGALARCSSYSALTRSEHAAARDHDPEDRVEVRKEPGLLGGLNLTGNRLGQRVHSLLEEVLGNGRPLDEVVENLDPSWKTALETILMTPIPLGSERVTLSEVQPRAIAEMHALLPVRTITPASLSEALLCDPLIAGDLDRRTWARELAHWTFSALAGFFQGYVDLIFERNGRFHIVDYKTNALPGYDPASLEAAMLDHHYVLQARLYAVALHRHLAVTLEGYDPEQHLGGCAYLFVRGFPGQGIWFERVGVAAVRALDELFAEASP
jgi:exodeoxyribonuclease V beta subunit